MEEKPQLDVSPQNGTHQCTATREPINLETPTESRTWFPMPPDSVGIVICNVGIVRLTKSHCIHQLMQQSEYLGGGIRDIRENV